MFSVVNTVCLPLFVAADDDHRAILKPLPGHPDCQSDYINASYVDVSKTPSIIKPSYLICLSQIRATPKQADSCPLKVCHKLLETPNVAPLHDSAAVVVTRPQ